MALPDDQPRTRQIGNRTLIVADVEPLDVDGVRTVVVGTAAWLIGFLVLLPFYDDLRASGRGWWMWTCLAGFLLGIAGFDYCRRRRRRRRLGRQTAADVMRGGGDGDQVG